MKIIKKADKSLIDKRSVLSIKPFEFKDFEINKIDSIKNFWVSNNNLNDKEAILSDIDNTAELIKQRARLAGREEGYKAGYEEGYKEGFEQFKRELDLIDKVKESLYKYKENLVRKLEPDIVRVAQYIAEKIIRQKINTEPGLILNIVNFALKQVTQLGKVIVYLNPEDYEFLKSNKSEIEDVLKNFDEIKLLDDKRIEKGGCIIETENGNIDAQPSSQLKIANRVLTNNLSIEQ